MLSLTGRVLATIGVVAGTGYALVWSWALSSQTYNIYGALAVVLTADGRDRLGVIAVGFTSDVWGGTAQVLFGSPTELAYGTVLHEIEHLYQQEFLAGRNVFTPGWFIEGDATFYQLEDMGYALDYVDVLVDAGQLPVLLQGSGPTTGDGASSITFWWRRCSEHSRSPRCRTVPCASASTCTSMWRGRSR